MAAIGSVGPDLDGHESSEFHLDAVLSSALSYLQHDRRSDRKTKRNEGKSYISSRGQLVPAKEFVPVESCCKRRCFTKMVAEEQRSAFKRFWENGSYNCQNNFLAGMMSSVETQYKKRCPKTHNRRCAWHYSVDNRGKKVTVCQLFFRTLLQVSEKRLRNLQEKLLSSEAIVDRRGTRGKRRSGASADVWVLLPHFCEMLPDIADQQTKGSVCFFDAEMTRSALFESFADYYEAVTGTELELAPSTFAKQFNTYMEYSFLCARK